MSCRRSATIRTSPATWTTSTSIYGREAWTRSGAHGPPSMKTSPPPRSRRKIPAWASAERWRFSARRWPDEQGEDGDDECRAAPLAVDSASCDTGDADRPRERASAGAGRNRPVDRTGRSEGAAGVRRSPQHALLQRQGRGNREQARRTVRRKTAEASRLHVLSAGHRLRQDDSRRAPL